MAIESSLGSVGTRLTLTGGSAEVYEHARDIDPELWAGTFGGSHKDFEYYQLIEDTQKAGFTYRYLVLRDASNHAVALQPLILADQDLAASAGTTLRRLVDHIRKISPRILQTRMLMAGCLVGEGNPGRTREADPATAAKLLAEALLLYAAKEGVALITVKDFSIAERAQMQPLIDASYTRLDSFPSLVLDLGFKSFAEYLETRVGKVTRKGLRRKLRESAKASPPIVLEVLSDCSAIIDEIYPLYLAVAKRSAVSFEVFTPEYFVEAGRRMPDRFRYFVWRQGGKAVAFSFCTILEDTIHDNDIGLDDSVARALHLYYVTFRDLIEWALANGLRYYRSAPFNYDAKLHLRLELVPLDLYVRHTNRIVNAAMRHIAPLFAPGKSDPVLREHARKGNP